LYALLVVSLKNKGFSMADNGLETDANGGKIVRKRRVKQPTNTQQPVTDAMLRIAVHQAKQAAKLVPGVNMEDFANGAEMVVAILKRRLGLSNWICEDQLPEGYDYDANYSRSKVIDGVRMFPK
jgi:hypothetical protein